MTHDHTGDEWVDLNLVTGVSAFAVNAIVTMNEDGAGRAVLVSLIDTDSKPYHFIFDPAVSGRMGWELVGHSNDYIAEFIEDNFSPDGIDFEHGAVQLYDQEAEDEED